MEDRQSRIREEQRQGGKGTAYAIAVSHMLKKDLTLSTSTSTTTSTSARDRKPSRTVVDATTATASTSSLKSGRTTAAKNSSKTVEAGAVGVRFAGLEEEGGDGRGVDMDQQSDVDDDAAAGDVGTSGASGDGDGDGCDSDSGSDSKLSASEEEEEEEHTRRNWAERRARLRKDGMHGRRLPPPQAEEERATAKAEKREVRQSPGDCYCDWLISNDFVRETRGRSVAR